MIRIIRHISASKELILLLIFLLPLALFSAPKKIEKIRFRHVKFKGDEKLRHIIKSEKDKEFEPRLVKLDKILLTNYYKKNGFLDIVVYDSLHLNKKEKTIRIIYTLKEGQRYFYGGVRFKGNYDITTRKLVSKFDDMKLYSPFDEEAVSVAAKEVENLYYNSGKPFIKMDVNYLYEQDSLIVVYMDLVENQTVHLTKLRYEGLKLVKKHVINRELEFEEGDIYNRAEIDATQKNLYGTGLFKYVRNQIEPLPNKEGQVRLKIYFQEKDPKWIGARFGIAHEQEVYYGNKLEFTLQGGHRNLFGTGRSVSLHITPSLTYDFTEKKIHNPNNKIALQFVQPWFFNSPTPIAMRMQYEQFRPLNTGHFDLWYINLDARRKLKKINELSASLSAKLVDLLSDEKIDSTDAAAYQVDKSKVYSLTLYYKRDKRKNVFNPRSSTYTDVSAAFSYAEGKDKDDNNIQNNYVSLSASWQRYQPWWPQVLNFRRWRFTLATRIKAGAILEPFGRKTVPISDLYFAGGATTVRGYSEQLLGPALVKDKKGRIETAAGGKLLYIMNAEVRIPLPWLFIGTYFVDGGYVWPVVRDFKFSDIRVSTGIGLALMTPLGPVRVDYGYKLARRKIDPSPDSFHIGIYFAF